MSEDLCLLLTSCDEGTSLTEARDALLLCLPPPECLYPHHHLGPPVPSSAALQASPPVGCRGPRWDHRCGHSAFLPFLRRCLGFSLGFRVESAGTRQPQPSTPRDQDTASPFWSCALVLSLESAGPHSPPSPQQLTGSHY